MKMTEFRETEKYQLLDDAMHAFLEWEDCCAPRQRQEVIEMIGEGGWELEMRVVAQTLMMRLEQLAKLARIWGMDVSAIDVENQRVMPLPDAVEERTRRGRMWLFFRQFKREAEAHWLKDKCCSDEEMAAHLRGTDDEIAMPKALGDQTPIPQPPKGIGYAGIREIMRHFGIPSEKREALAGRLRRLQKKHAADPELFVEHDSPARNRPRFLYNVAKIADDIKDLSVIAR